MAKVFKKSNALINEYKAYKRKIRNCWLYSFIVAVVISAVSYFGKIYILFAAVPLPFFISSFLTAFYMRELEILAAGIEGEQNSARLISRLPEDFCGFQNVKVTFKGKTSETDLIVIGPTGIFIIEVKNLNGTVIGNYESTKWTQHKVGRGGTPYSKKFYSPVKQVGTHIYRLANHLRQNGIRQYVNGCVFFANPECRLQINGSPDKIPVFGSSDELIRYIISGEKVLNGSEIKQIGDFLKKG